MLHALCLYISSLFIIKHCRKTLPIQNLQIELKRKKFLFSKNSSAEIIAFGKVS